MMSSGISTLFTIFAWLLIRNTHARKSTNSIFNSYLREPASVESISTRSLVSASRALNIVGGGSGNVSLITEEEDGGSEDDDLSTELRDRTISNGGLAKESDDSSQQKSSTAVPLRISSRKGKEVTTQTRIDMRSQKKLERQRRKEENKSHRIYAKKHLKNRNHLNLSRKVVHAGFGLFFASLNHILPKEKFVPGMVVLSTSTLVMELLRYRKGFGWMNKALIFFLGGSLRKHEMEGKFTGSFYYFLGVTITAACFPTSCASLGICQLALADPSASYFGRKTRDVYWSRIENGFFGLGRNKGILGFLGGALFCLPFNYRVLSVAKFGSTGIIPGGRSNVAIASLALGFAGAFADLMVPTPALTMPKKILGVPMPPFHVDDNVVVPIFSAYACTKIFHCVGWTEGVDLAKAILF